MADLRAVVQYLGERVLGEKFDIDAFEVPADVLAKIDRPSEEIAAVRGDFARALEAIGLEVAPLSDRIAALEKAPTILPPVVYEAAQRAVAARMASVVPDHQSSALDHAAIAGLADRIDRLEQAMSHNRDELRAHIEAPVTALSTYVSASSDNSEIADLRKMVKAAVESVSAVLEYNEAREDATIAALRVHAEQMQLSLARSASLEADLKGVNAILDDVTQAQLMITDKLKRRA